MDIRSRFIPALLVALLAFAANGCRRAEPANPEPPADCRQYRPCRPHSELRPREKTGPPGCDWIHSVPGKTATVAGTFQEACS